MWQWYFRRTEVVPGSTKCIFFVRKANFKGFNKALFKKEYFDYEQRMQHYLVFNKHVFLKNTSSIIIFFWGGGKFQDLNPETLFGDVLFKTE